MGYLTDDNWVRVDFFKESGKWYCTESLFWDRYEVHKIESEIKTEFINDTFKRCLQEQFAGRFKDMTAVCLEPYHENSHPLMIRIF